jgi:hypothetical protein
MCACACFYAVRRLQSLWLDVRVCARSDRVQLLWLYVGSCNLSTAALGSLQKQVSRCCRRCIGTTFFDMRGGESFVFLQNTQLFVRSYELGVMYLPSAFATAAGPATFRVEFEPGRASASVGGGASAAGGASTAGGAFSRAGAGGGATHDDDDDSDDAMLQLAIAQSIGPSNDSETLDLTAEGSDDGTDVEDGELLRRLMMLPKLPVDTTAATPLRVVTGSGAPLPTAPVAPSASAAVSATAPGAPPRPPAGAALRRRAVEVVSGDLLAPGFTYIAHQCNCVSRGARGLAKALFARFPHANVYRHRNGRPSVPGTP